MFNRVNLLPAKPEWQSPNGKARMAKPECLISSPAPRCRKAIIRLLGKPPPIDDNTFIIG